MEWVTSFLGAGSFTALVQIFFGWLRDARHRKSQAAYLAMRLAVILETYAFSCSNFIDENSASETPPDQQYPSWNMHLPDLLPFPDDSDGWRAIDIKLARRCLNFQNKIRNSQSSVHWTIEFSEDTLGDTLDSEASLLGLDALELASELSQRYKLGQFSEGSDCADRLKKVFDRSKTELLRIQHDNEQALKDVLQS